MHDLGLVGQYARAGANIALKNTAKSTGKVILKYGLSLGALVSGITAGMLYAIKKKKHGK